MNEPTIQLPGKHADPILRVGLDLDNTLLRNDHVWRNRFRTHCIAEIPHRQVAPDEIQYRYDHFRRLCGPCFEECISSPYILEAHEPIAEAVSYVADLYNRGVEFHVITSRPTDAVDSTLRWLQRHELADRVATLTITDIKRPVCERLALELIIDDSPHVYAEMMHPAPSSCRIILFAGTHNVELQVPERAESWEEIYNRLSQILETRSI